MSSHLVRHIPQHHRVFTCMQKNRVTKSVWRLELSYPAQKQEKHSQPQQFLPIEGRYWTWGGIFKRQLFKAIHPIVDGNYAVKKGSTFIFAWAGTMNHLGEFAPQTFLQGILRKDNFTHYRVIFRLPQDRNPTSVFIRRELVEGKAQ